MYYYPNSKKQFLSYVHTTINNKHQRRVRTVLKKPEVPLMLCTVKLNFVKKNSRMNSKGLTRSEDNLI